MVKSDALQYRPVLEEFKACIAEAVSTTGDLCEEITDVVDIFNCHYQKYSELSSTIDRIQEHLASTRKNLSEVIDRLKLQEEERASENKKIANGEMKLKDMKNMVNQARSEMFQNVGNVEDDREVFSQCGNTKMHTFDNLLDSIAAEVEQVLRDLQIREVLESNVTSILVELKKQLCASEFSFKDLQRKANNILLNNETSQSTFRKKMMNMNKLGEEFANVCKKMQDLSGNSKIDKEQIGMRTEVRNHLEGSRELNKGVLERSQKYFNTFRVSKSFKLLQNAIHSTENGLQELGNEFKKLVDDKSSHSFISMGSVESALDVLRRYQEGMENCMVEVETLRNALSSKEKLLENKDEIIMIQKDSIRMTQAELKDLYQKERQIDALVTSKNCLEDKYVKIKRLWQEATEELQKLKCTSRGNRVKCRTQGVMCKVTTKDGTCITDEFENEVDSVDCSVLATMEELQGQLYECNCQVTQLKTTLKESARVKEELERGIDTLLRDNEDMKKQLQKYQVDFEILDEELKIEKEKQDERKASKGTACDLEGRKLHAATQHGKNIDAIVAREMLQKHNIELEKLIVDTKDKQEELRVLQEVRKQFERIEDMEKVNDSLTKDLNDLLAEERNKDLKLAKCIERVSCLYEDIDVKKKEILSLYAQIACCEAAKCEQTRMIEQLEEKAQLYEQETDDCLFELNASKEIISILQNRVCSLRGLLKEKSDHMAKLQADYEMLKNENCILKTEAAIAQNKAREDVCNLNAKLKGLRFQLHLVEDNYRRVSNDYKISQELLVETAQREADLQHTITVMEKNFLCKLSAAEKQEANLNEIVDKLNEELDIARCRLASKCFELCQTQSQLQVIQPDIQKLKEELMKMEGANCCLSRQLKRCRDENVTLFERNKVLELDNIKYVTELEDMHKSLLELRKECQLKAESLACMTAELNLTAASKSELCSESQYVVSCIRDWMEEQKRLVDTLALRLKQKQQRLSQLEFQNKTLCAMVKKLRGLNVSISQRLKRYRSTKSTCINCPVPRLRVPCCRKVRICSSSSTCTRSLKKCGPIKTMRKTSVCGNSWWFPKMEHLLKEVRRSSQWRSENTTNCRTGNDPRLDESRDYGYQSSTSK